VSRPGRLAAETGAAWRAFLRRRTAVFFTFFFPVIIVVIFGVLIQTQPTSGGIFAEPAGWYLPGYLAVVVLFTPLSRVGSEVARHRDGNRFEKLATTPLTRPEWLLVQTLVNVLVIGVAGLVLLGLLVAATDAAIRISLSLALLVPFVVVGVAVFCAVGALIGSFARSQDGVIAASNGIAIPVLFLSETFVPADMLPAWLPTELSPLTFFARGVRQITFAGGEGEVILAVSRGQAGPLVNLAVLTVVAIVLFVLAARSLPRTD
jgi:ABC-2 type transport system permease protein